MNTSTKTEIDKNINLQSKKPDITVDVMRYAIIKVANYLIENTDVEVDYMQKIEGFTCRITGFCITVCDSEKFSSSHFESELKYLDNAYNYYKRVRELAKYLAKEMAQSMLPEKIWTRDGNKFVRVK